MATQGDNHIMPFRLKRSIMSLALYKTMLRFMQYCYQGEYQAWSSTRRQCYCHLAHLKEMSMKSMPAQLEGQPTDWLQRKPFAVCGGSTCLTYKPMTDLCWICQKNSTAIVRSAHAPLERQSEVTQLHKVYVYNSPHIGTTESSRAHWTREGRKRWVPTRAQRGSRSSGSNWGTTHQQTIIANWHHGTLQLWLCSTGIMFCQNTVTYTKFAGPLSIKSSPAWAHLFSYTQEMCNLWCVLWSSATAGKLPDRRSCWYW